MSTKNTCQKSTSGELSAKSQAISAKNYAIFGPNLPFPQHYPWLEFKITTRFDNRKQGGLS
jgi:hypothetical protein